MTANQIAAKAELEDERHNVSVEEETHRHNVAMEDLTDQQTQIQAKYNTDYLALQKSINENRLAYEYATLAEKEQYDQQYLGLQQELYELDDWYKTQMTILKGQEQAEIKSYHEAQVGLGFYQAEIEEKRIDYQKHQWDEQNNLTREQYGIERMELLNQQTITQANISQKIADTQLAMMQMDLAYKEYSLKASQFNLQEWQTKKEMGLKQQYYNLELKNAKSERFRNYTSGVGTLFHSNSEGVSNALKVVTSFF